jgi:hypothetical protein
VSDLSADLDERVLQALAAWEDTATGHDHVSVEQLTTMLQLPADDATRVARSVKRLVDSGQVEAMNITAMGSPYPQFIMTGLSAGGLRAARALGRQPRASGPIEQAEPTFLGVRRVDISKDTRQIFVAYPYSIPADEYRATYRKVGDRYGVRFVYADERITNMHVLAKIYTMILESAFGIYDVSGWNANVTLELGMALGLRETSYIVLNPTAHVSADAPADLRGFDRIEYRSLDELGNRLEQLLVGLGLRSK